MSVHIRTVIERVNLIVDVRGNDGGHPDYAIDLFRYLMHKDFVYFKTGVSVEKWNHPYENSFKGQVYILNSY